MCGLGDMHIWPRITKYCICVDAGDEYVAAEESVRK